MTKMTEAGLPNLFVVNPFIRGEGESARAEGIYQLTTDGDILPSGIEPKDRMAFEDSCDVYARFFNGSNEAPRKGFILRISEVGGNIGSRRFVIVSTVDWPYYPTSTEDGYYGYRRIAQEAAQITKKPNLTILIAS